MGWERLSGGQGCGAREDDEEDADGADEEDADGADDDEDGADDAEDGPEYGADDAEDGPEDDAAVVAGACAGEDEVADAAEVDARLTLDS